jgi:hypothetical protein
MGLNYVVGAWLARPVGLIALYARFRFDRLSAAPLTLPWKGWLPALSRGGEGGQVCSELDRALRLSEPVLSLSNVGRGRAFGSRVGMRSNLAPSPFRSAEGQAPRPSPVWERGFCGLDAWI